jgi:hypothetical protein
VRSTATSASSATPFAPVWVQAGPRTHDRLLTMHEVEALRTAPAEAAFPATGQETVEPVFEAQKSRPGRPSPTVDDLCALE